MATLKSKRWVLLPWVFVCATVGVLVAEKAAAQTNTSSGWWPFNRSTTSSPSQDKDYDDAIALKKQAKPSVELYVSVAHLYVVSGKFAEAEGQYQQAMKIAPDDMRVLLGYATLKDQMNQPQEAMKFYLKAQQKYPKQPPVYNDLAVHYVRFGMVREAMAAAQHAVELSPREPRYRNNLAALLVEAGMPQEAFKQLRAVYDEPVAHYDLGFLLNKRGMKAAALQEFTIALQLSPGMALARQWVERLSRERAESGPAVAGAAANPFYGREVPPPPMAPVPPQYVVPPHYPAPPPPSAPVQYSAQSPPAQVQYPAQTQYPVLPHYPLQNGGPQYTVAPQYQNPATPAGVNPAPVVAARDPQVTGSHIIRPRTDDADTLRRLPPVADPRWPANDRNRDPQGSELVAPNPPDWQR